VSASSRSVCTPWRISSEAEAEVGVEVLSLAQTLRKGLLEAMLRRFFFGIRVGGRHHERRLQNKAETYAPSAKRHETSSRI
jgi:hypothetical protein